MSIKLRYFINLATAPLVFMHLASDLPDDEAAALPYGENVRFFFYFIYSINNIIFFVVVVVINYIHYYYYIFYLYIIVHSRVLYYYYIIINYERHSVFVSSC